MICWNFISQVNKLALYVIKTSCSNCKILWDLKKYEVNSWTFHFWALIILMKLGVLSNWFQGLNPTHQKKTPGVDPKPPKKFFFYFKIRQIFKPIKSLAEENLKVSFLNFFCSTLDQSTFNVFQALTNIRYLTMPFPFPLCQLDYLLKNVIIQKGLMFVDFILIVRYLFTFHSKNPTAVQEDFWVLFISMWTIGEKRIYCVIIFLLSWI